MNTVHKVRGIKAGTAAQLSTQSQPPDPAGTLNKPASNATRLLEKPRLRRRAHADQAILQKKGPNALPVSDYPLKEGLAANTIDSQAQDAAVKQE